VTSHLLIDYYWAKAVESERFLVENIEVGTRNPRVSGYISPELYRLVETHLSENSLTQSDLVQRALTAYLLVGISTVALPDDLRNKLETLARKSYRSPEDQARFLLQEIIERLWSEQNG
jgi:hypothetical protein